MRLIVFSVVAATAVGLLAGGTLRGFPSAKIRAGWLALVGVVLQFVPVGGTPGTVLLYTSFAALMAFTVLNIRTHGFALILLGLALNTVVIVANEGMPVTREALAGSNQAETLADLVANGGSKHHLAGEDTVLLPLGDVISVGAPLDQAISIGDVCVQLGAAWFIVFSMPKRHPRIARTKATA